MDRIQKVFESYFIIFAKIARFTIFLCLGVPNTFAPALYSYVHKDLESHEMIVALEYNELPERGIYMDILNLLCIKKRRCFLANETTDKLANEGSTTLAIKPILISKHQDNDTKRCLEESLKQIGND